MNDDMLCPLLIVKNCVECEEGAIMNEFEKSNSNTQKVIAVVVTYNRKTLLQECLTAIKEQKYPVWNTIIIDNASTDGTGDMLRDSGFLQNDSFVYKKMKSNLGGSGGFCEGIKLANAFECDWIWIMDDDTIPTKECLVGLLNAEINIREKRKLQGEDCARETAFLASTVYGPNGEYMNLPGISNRPSPNGYEYWYSFLNEGIVAIESATFVSILIRKVAVEHCGLPCKDYFIWGDDTEYTMRLSKYFGEGYFVGDSVAIHKRVGAKALHIENETNPSRIDMFHYLYRNQAINDRYYKKEYHPIIGTFKSVISAMKLLQLPQGSRMAKVVIKGRIEALTQYKNFKNYIDGQLRCDKMEND